MIKQTKLLAGAALMLLASTTASLGAAESYFPECFAAWDETTAPLAVVEPREGPYRIAFVNGFAGNDWRIQAIQSAKAYAARPETAAKLKEFAVVSVGSDVAAQISAIENYVSAGFDAVLVIANNTESFDPVIRRANREGTLLVSFDNVINNPDHLVVDINHFDVIYTKTTEVLNQIRSSGKTGGKLLEVRGLAGTGADAEMHAGFVQAVADNSAGLDIEVIEVVGNWDSGETQKLTADTIATHGEIAGAVVQFGTQGLVQALVDAKHAPIPVGSDTVNGAVRLLSQNGYGGITMASSPSISALAVEAAIAALEGKAMPQRVKVPLPSLPSSDWAEGVAFDSTLPDTFIMSTGFDACNVKFTAQELLAQPL
jgi:ribose transport system substrate-binding protein